MYQTSSGEIAVTFHSQPLDSILATPITLPSGIQIKHFSHVKRSCTHLFLDDC